MAGAGVEPALNLYPAEREGFALPGYQKIKKVMKVASLRYCAERGSRTPAPDLPTNALIYHSQGLHYSPQVPVFPGCHFNDNCIMSNASLRWREGGESNPASDRNSLSFPFQAGLHSRACLSMFCVKVTVSPSWNPGRASPPPGQLQSLY